LFNNYQNEINSLNNSFGINTILIILMYNYINTFFLLKFDIYSNIFKNKNHFLKKYLFILQLYFNLVNIYSKNYIFLIYIKIFQNHQNLLCYLLLILDRSFKIEKLYLNNLCMFFIIILMTSQYLYYIFNILVYLINFRIYPYLKYNLDDIISFFLYKPFQYHKLKLLNNLSIQIMSCNQIINQLVENLKLIYLNTLHQ